MKICFLVKAVPVHQKGGLQDIVMMLAKGLARAGNEVVIITTKHPDNVEKEFVEGVAIYYLNDTRSSSYSRAWWKYSLAKFAQLNETYAFDVVHSHSIAGFSVINKKRKMKLVCPTVITMHGTFWDELRTKINIGLSLTEWTENVYLLGGLARQLFNFILFEYKANRKADMVVATSNEQYHLIKKLYSLPSDKIKIVFNGIDLNCFLSDKVSEGEIRHRYNIPSSTKIILALARLHKEKGIQYLIEALPLIQNNIPDSVLLVVGDGRYKKELAKLTKKKNVGEKVIFAGKVDFDELSSYFKSSDVFVDPTIRQNGYDLTILEAMQCGVPVVATNIGSVPTVIQHNVNGFLVRIKNKEHLANGVSFVLDPVNTILVSDITKNAMNTVEKSFGMEIMIQKTLESYRDLLHGYQHREAELHE